MRWCISFCPVRGGLAEFHWPPQHDIFMTEINFLNEIFMPPTLVRWFMSTSLQAAGVWWLRQNSSELLHIMMAKLYLWKIKLIYELISDNMSVYQPLVVCGQRHCWLQEPFRQNSKINCIISWNFLYSEKIYKHTSCFCSHFLWAKLKDVRWMDYLCIEEVLRLVNYIYTQNIRARDKWEQKQNCCNFGFIQCNCERC